MNGQKMTFENYSSSSLCFSFVCTIMLVIIVFLLGKKTGVPPCSPYGQQYGSPQSYGQPMQTFSPQMQAPVNNFSSQM